LNAKQAGENDHDYDYDYDYEHDIRNIGVICEIGGCSSLFLLCGLVALCEA